MSYFEPKKNDQYHIESNKKSQINVNYMNNTLLINILNDTNISNNEHIEKIILKYISLRFKLKLRKSFLNEALQQVFKNHTIPKVIHDEELDNYTLTAKNAKLSPLETTIFFSIMSMFASASIVDYHFTIVLNKSFTDFLNFCNPRISKLYLENTHFNMLTDSEVIGLNGNQHCNDIIDDYGLCTNSYSLFYLLKSCNLLSSLKEIHIKQDHSLFWEELFQLIAKYFANKGKVNTIKVFYEDSEKKKKSVKEINQEYCEMVNNSTNLLMESMIDNGMQKKVSYFNIVKIIEEIIKLIFNKNILSIFNNVKTEFLHNK